MARRSVFLDTSFIVALVNKDDPYHARSKELDRRLLSEGAILCLHWGILFEIAQGFARLGRRHHGQLLLGRLQQEAAYHIFPITEDLFDEAISLFRSRTDKEWGLTDCALFTIMHRENIFDALTADVHFRQAGFNALLLEP